MRFYESRKLQCQKKVFTVKNGVRTETKNIKVQLSWVADGQEGGDFDTLFLDMNNPNQVTESLNTGDTIEIEATKKDGDTRYDMFDPIVILVEEDENGKKSLTLENYCTSGSWCFNIHPDLNGEE